MTFGTILREARERKGYDLSTAARRLRIRPDILRAIEDSDFSRMPPRGYARNMVNAYARLVGLNPTEMTRMYLDETYAYQVGRARTDTQPASSRFDMGDSARTSRSSRTRERTAQSSDERTPRQNALGRTVYDDRHNFGTRGSNTGSDRLYSEDRTHPSRHGALPDTQYTNFYAGPKAPSGMRSKLPFIIAGAVILVLLIIVLAFALGNRGGSSEDVKNVQVTGMTNTTQGETGTSGEEAEDTTPKVTAPTNLQVVYKIAKNTNVWAVITTNGVEEQKGFTGGEEDSVELTADGVWTFAAWASDSVTILVDGEAATFDGFTTDGVPMCTVDFNTYLDAWYEAHPEVKKPAADDTDTDATTGGTDAAAADGTNTAAV